MPAMPFETSPKFYLESLYPLQDEFLIFLNAFPEGEFYLTGGTALSRFYFQHRFSDDLDFFSRREMPDFRERVTKILAEAGKKRMDCEVETLSSHFLRVFLKKHSVLLKVDFVNEPVYRWGEFKKENVFDRIDNPVNILANKLTALSRYEAKDIADIWILAKRLSFSWREMFDIASKKSPVDPLETSRIIQSIPAEELRTVKWATSVDPVQVKKDLAGIAEDILGGRANSLNAGNSFTV